MTPKTGSFLMNMAALKRGGQKRSFWDFGHFGVPDITVCTFKLDPFFQEMSLFVILTHVKNDHFGGVTRWS